MVVFMILFTEEFRIIFTRTNYEESRGEIKLFDMSGVPMFFATILNMFEGNAMILNLYSEADKPQHF